MVSPITQNTASFRVVEQQLVGVWVFIYCHYYLLEHISIIDVHRSLSVTDDCILSPALVHARFMEMNRLLFVVDVKYGCL